MSKSRKTKQSGLDGGGRPVVRWGKPVMTAAVVVLAVGVLFGGCTQEAWQRENWTLNPFKKDKTTSPEAGSKARRPSNSATASNTPPKTNSTNAKTAAKPAEANDPKAEQVNRDVEAYAQRFPAKGQAGSEPQGTSATDSTPSGSGARTNAGARPNTTARTTAKPPTGTGPNGTAGALSSRPPTATSTTPVATRTSKPARPAEEDNGELTLIGSTPASGQPITDSTANTVNSGGNPSANAPMSGGGATAIESAGSTSTAGSLTASNANNPPSGISGETSSTPAQPIGSGEIRSTDTAMTSAQPITTNDKPAMKASDKSATTANDERPPVIGSIRVEAGSETDVADTETPTPIAKKPETPATIEPIRGPGKASNHDAIKPIPTEPKTDAVADAAKPVPAAPIQPKISEPVKSPVIESSKPIATETPGKAATANTPPISNSPLAGLESAVAQDPNNIDKQLKLRMAYLLNDDEERAMAPTPGMSEDTQKVVLAQIKAMISAKGATGRDSAGAAQAQLASAEAIRTAAKDKADLQVPRVVLCTSIRRFGDYTPITPLIFPAGKKNQALLYIEVENYQSRPTNDGQYEVLLSMRESLLDAKGKELWAFQTPKIQDISRQQREDFFLSTQPRTIPPGLPAGEYAYKVEVEDLIAGKINSNMTKFKLVATQPN